LGGEVAGRGRPIGCAQLSRTYDKGRTAERLAKESGKVRDIIADQRWLPAALGPDARRQNWSSDPFFVILLRFDIGRRCRRRRSLQAMLSHLFAMANASQMTHAPPVASSPSSPPWVAYVALGVSLLSLALAFVLAVQKWRSDAKGRSAQAKPFLTLGNDRLTNEYWPVSGHRLHNGNPVDVVFYAGNGGDPKAEDVIVRVELPQWVHPLPRSPKQIPVPGKFGVEWVTGEADTSEDLSFKTHSNSSGRSVQTSEVRMSRPLYPGQQQQVGIGHLSMPEGTHRIDWRIESSAGIVESDEDTCLSVIIHDTAVGHTPLTRHDEDYNLINDCPKCVEIQEKFKHGGILLP